MTDIVERLRETAECADYVVDRETATEAAAEIVRLRIDIGSMLLEREEANAEAERLRAALEQIAGCKPHMIGWWAVILARAALENNNG